MPNIKVLKPYATAPRILRAFIKECTSEQLKFKAICLLAELEGIAATRTSIDETSGLDAQASAELINSLAEDPAESILRSQQALAAIFPTLAHEAGA